MKKILMAVAVILVVVAGGAVLLFSNLDTIVETAIETAGTSALGAKVEVGSVDINLVGGAASIHDFSVANPEGFSDGPMVRFDELSVVLDIQDLSTDRIHINSVVARSPYVLFERHGGTSNLDTVNARFSKDGETADTEESTGPQPTIVLDSLLIQDIQGSLQSDKLPAPVNVSLGDITLSGLEGTPDALAREIMAPVLSQITANALQALARATAGLLTENAQEVGEKLRQEAGEKLEDAGDKLQESLDDAADKAKEKLGNLLKRD